MWETELCTGGNNQRGGIVIGCGVNEVSIMPVVSPCGIVIFSPLGYFLSVVSSSKTSHPYLPLSLGVHHIQEYLKKKRVRKRKSTEPQEERSRHEEWRNQMRVTVQAKLVVGY